MALKIPSRIKQTTSTTGVGTYNLIAPPSNLRAFSTRFSSGDVVMYMAQDGSSYELGVGTFTTGSPDTISRTSIIISSNANAAVNWGAGTRDIYAVWPANARFPISFSTLQTIDVSDWGNVFVFTGTTLTQSLPAVAGLPAGYSIYFRNAGSGALTLDPNGAELIEGAATYAVNANNSVECIIVAGAWRVLTTTQVAASQAALDAGTAGTFPTSDLFAGARLGHGQCQLVKSGANLQLNPMNGKYLYVPGAGYMSCAAAPTLAVGTALREGGTPAANTLYYIYAYNVSGTLTLRASATGYTTDANGIKVCSAASGDVLVGMARTNATPAWVDTDAQRFVLSYYNRRNIRAITPFTSNATTTSATYVELNSAFRAEFLAWADEALTLGFNGNQAGGGGNVNTSIGLDSATALETWNMGASAANVPVANTLVHTGHADGYHYVTGLANIGGGFTATFPGGASAGARCSVFAMTRG